MLHFVHRVLMSCKRLFINVGKSAKICAPPPKKKHKLAKVLEICNKQYVSDLIASG